MMDEKNREIWVGENRFYLNEDKVMFVTVVGEHDKENALAMRDAFDTLLSLVDGKVNIFVDNNKDKKSSTEARRIFKGIVEHERCGKVTIFGLHPVARVLASFFIGASNKKDMRFFKTKEDAFRWLRE